MELLDLPDALLLEVLSHANVSELATVGCVSRRLHALSHQPWTHVSFARVPTARLNVVHSNLDYVARALGRCWTPTPAQQSLSDGADGAVAAFAALAGPAALTATGGSPACHLRSLELPAAALGTAGAAVLSSFRLLSLARAAPRLSVLRLGGLGPLKLAAVAALLAACRSLALLEVDLKVFSEDWHSAQAAAAEPGANGGLIVGAPALPPRAFARRQLEAALALVGDPRVALVGLSLAHTRMDADDAADVADALARAGRRMAGLLALDVSSNPLLREDGAVAIARALPGLPALSALSLRHCGLGVGTAAVSALADALADPACALTRLDLARNAITASGAGALAAALLRNTTLEWLSLDGNQIANRGANSLACALAAHHALKYVNVEGCRISAEGCALENVDPAVRVFW